MTYILAEIASSHNGKPENIREMADIAYQCGCDGIKYQVW